MISWRVNPSETAPSPAWGAMLLYCAIRSQIMNSRVTHGSYIWNPGYRSTTRSWNRTLPSSRSIPITVAVNDLEIEPI